MTSSYIPKTFEPRKCENCGDEYTPVKSNQRFCNLTCHTVAKSKRQAAKRSADRAARFSFRVCEQCRQPIPIERGRGAVYCGAECKRAADVARLRAKFVRRDAGPEGESGQQRIDRQVRAVRKRENDAIERVVAAALARGTQCKTSAEHLEHGLRLAGSVRCTKVG